MSKKTHLVCSLVLMLILVASSAVLYASNWPMFRCNWSHTASTVVEGPDSPVVAWSKYVGGSGNASPVVVNGRVYLTTGVSLIAYDPSNDQLWSVPCATSGSSSPAIAADGTVHVASSDGYLYWYRSDLTFIRKKYLGAPTEASPTVDSTGNVYIGCSNGKLHAFNKYGSVKFQAFPAGGAIASSPAVAPDGTIYFGCDDGNLYAVSKTGQEKWTFPTYLKTPIKSSPAIGPDGTIYIANIDNAIYGVYPSGNQRWRVFAGSAVCSSPAVDPDGLVYIGSRDGKFYCINNLGKVVWSYSVGVFIDSSPAIDSRGVTYIGANDGKIYAFSRDGSKMWESPVGSSVTSSPAIGESGTMYVYTADGYLCGFDNTTQPPTTPVVIDDGAYSTSPSRIHASWSATDARSGIAKYEYAIGTARGSEDLVSFTDAGLDTEITLDGLALVNGSSYFISVRATNNAGLVSEVGVSDGIIVDYTPPVTPLVVDDGSFTGSSDTLHFVYSSGDLESGTNYYEYSIGTAPGLQDAVGWSWAGLVKEQTVSSLTLSHNKKYFVNIRAYNNAGLMSEGCSNGILVDLTDPIVKSISPQMTSTEVRVKVAGSDPESGVNEVRCALLDSPQLPESPNWVSGVPGSDITITAQLDPAKIYYVAVKIKNGADKWSSVEISEQVHFDNTPPTTPLVTDDGAFQCDNRGIHASWSSADPESGITHYSYCVGTMPGLDNLVNWTDTTETSVSRTGLVLTNSGTYYFSVRATNGVGLVSAAGYSDGITIDTTPPGKPVVTDDGAFTSLPDSLHASWTAADNESGISDYSYCVGTAPGAADVVSWASSNGKNAVTVYELALDPTITYYFTVKARNGGGCWGEPVSSDGIKYLPGVSVWPKFRCNNQNSGCSTLNGCITGRLRWQVQTQGYVESSPAVGSDGTVYIGASDGKLYAISANAAIKWTFQTGACIESSPAIGVDGCIYFGSHDGYLYCVYPNGTLKWKYGTGGMIWSSPAIDSSGTIYFGCHDSYLYALRQDGTLKWKYRSGGEIWSSPAIAGDGTIYFGCGDGRLYAIDPSGSVRWSFVTGSAIDSSPAIDSAGIIYFGSGDGYFYSLYPNGSLRWRYKTGKVTDSSPVITSDGRICFGTGAIGTTGEIYSLNSMGQITWKMSLLSGVRSSPASAADGTIYVGSADGTIYAIAHDGAKVWSYHTGQSILGSPAITSDGSVIIGSDDGSVYSFRDFGGIDTTGPSEPKVKTARSFISPGDAISASWIASDLESGVQGYSYAIGTAPGSGDLLNWTNAGPVTSVNQVSLPLQLGRTYYVSVVAHNYASLQSLVGASHGITVVSGNPLNTIGATKKRPAGTRVYLPGKVVSAVCQDCLFIQEVDRSAGIRAMLTPLGVEPGSVVNILGTVSFKNSEVVLTDVVIELCGFSAEMKPLSALIRTITDINQPLTGMLVRVAGNVISTDVDRMVVSDGSGSELPILLQGQKPSVGAYASVSGVLYVEIVNGQPTIVLKAIGLNPLRTY